MIPTREQMDFVADTLLSLESSHDHHANTALAAVAAYLKSPPKADRVDEIVALLKKYAPASISLVAHHAWTDGIGESWSITGGARHGISYNSPDALIAAIHAHFNAPVLVDMQPVVADEPSDYEGLDTALVRAEMAVAPTLDLANAPLKEGDWVEVVGESASGETDRGVGPHIVVRVDIDGDVWLPCDGPRGNIYPRSSLRGPVPAPKEA